jgi:hypothetical protein
VDLLVLAEKGKPGADVTESADDEQLAAQWTPCWFCPTAVARRLRVTALAQAEALQTDAFLASDDFSWPAPRQLVVGRAGRVGA